MRRVDITDFDGALNMYAGECARTGTRRSSVGGRAAQTDLLPVRIGTQIWSVIGSCPGRKAPLKVPMAGFEGGGSTSATSRISQFMN